ncbi:DUF4124 domain-containing protein, partial [candidate division KSB3 bacterium]|nr:DUF4124 domain-containing protein [candidate division KSB3 bacterium]MBD3323720.1 DUF4124 domain-containing protein [candidate division KSB3 bacterium]
MQHLQKLYRSKLLHFSLVLLLILIGLPYAPAEMYRWQDPDGVIRYANTPPKDSSRVLEIIPTKRIPLVEDTNGVV